MSGNPIVEAVEKVNEAFDEYKKVNDERLDAESKGMTPRHVSFPRSWNALMPTSLKRKRPKRMPSVNS